jgi:hypothetical protein
MKIFNHRGQVQGPQNISQEIDLRAVDNFCDDLGGHIGAYLVVEHDLSVRPDGESFEQTYLPRWLRQADPNAILALNIKEDGLAQMVKEVVISVGLLPDQFFCFDMSQAETQHYQALHLPIATRASFYGIDNPIGNYIWFDWFPNLGSFRRLYADACNIYNQYGYRHYQIDNRVIAISPELHDSTMRVDDVRAFWSFCKETGFFGVCTDYPEEAGEYFNGTDQGSAE